MHRHVRRVGLDGDGVVGSRFEVGGGCRSSNELFLGWVKKRWLDRGTAAVGGEDRTGQVAGLVGGQEGDDLGDLADFGGPPEEGGLAETLDQVGLLRSAVDRSGGDRVDPNALGLYSAAHERAIEAIAALVAP